MGVPEELVRPVPIVYAMDAEVDTIDLKVMYEEQRTYAQMCNGQLAEIQGLADTSFAGTPEQ